MKNLKKALAIIVSFALLLAVAIVPVYALGGMLGGSLGDLIGGLLNGGADNSTGNEAVVFSELLKNPGGILDALRERLKDYNLGDVSNFDLVTALSRLLNGDSANLKDILGGTIDNSTIGQLASLLGGIIPSTTEPTTEIPTALPSISYEYSTYEIPTYTVPSTNVVITLPPSTVFSGADPYSTLPTVPTTEPAYSSTDVVTAPTYSQPELTAASYNVQDNVTYDYSNTRTPQQDNGKMIIGAVIVAVALAAVVVVAIMLKKSKI